MLHPKCFVPDRPVLTHRPTAATPPPLRGRLSTALPERAAQVAELVDAQVSGTCGRKVVEVRVFSWAPASQMSSTRNSCRAAPSICTGTICRRASSLGPVVAVDTETMGLNPHRDRLCLVQLSAGDGHAHLVQLDPAGRSAAVASTAPT